MSTARKPLKAVKSEHVKIEEEIPNSVSLSLTMRGETDLPYCLLAIFDNQIVLDGMWVNGETMYSSALALDFIHAEDVSLAADNPIILILRLAGNKVGKESGPLIHSDNKAGGSIDLYPLVMGQPNIFTNVPLIQIHTGLYTEFSVDALVSAEPPIGSENIPLMITMVRGECFPLPDSSYVSAVGLDNLIYPASVNFGLSQNPVSTPINQTIWACASDICHAAKTGYDVPDDDIFVPEGMDLIHNDTCITWNAMKRVLVNPMSLRDRLLSPFAVEVAATSRAGKPDSKNRYIGFVDAGVLLQPNQLSVTTCARLLYYKSDLLPEGQPLLEIPPSSAKGGNEGPVSDVFGNMSYIVITFDLTEALMIKTQTAYLFESIGLPPPEGHTKVVEELWKEPQPEDPRIDVNRIRMECGALAVHAELSNLASRGPVPMNQSIKRTAANRLMMRIRAMVKQFPPGECPNIEWQDTVTAHHAASRQAVTASFQPQPPPLYKTSRAVCKAIVGGEKQIADKLIETNLIAAPNHPKPLMAKALQCLELEHYVEAQKYLIEALRTQPKNKFLLWTYAAVLFNKGDKNKEKTVAALRIAANICDRVDGPAQVIAWAALHATYHLYEDEHAAFVALKRMRKGFQLPMGWKRFVQRWESASKIEESFWFPSVLRVYDPFVTSAAFFLCLRSYDFSELLLQCHERGCSTRGTLIKAPYQLTPDLVYVRASSLLLKRKFDEAITMIDSGVKVLGPSAILSQLRATCVLSASGWDRECEIALEEADKAGAKECPTVLLAAALGGMNTDPTVALQRVARAHKISPSAYTSLGFARIYEKLQEIELAERWAAIAVKLEPLHADAWAFLGILALQDRNLDKARTMIRTANQSGEISKGMQERLDDLMTVLDAQSLPNKLTENLCLCDDY